MAKAMAMNTKDSPAWVKMNLLPWRKSWVSDLTVFSVCARAARITTRREIMAAEKTKLAMSRKKQDFSVNQETNRPAAKGDNRRTTKNACCIKALAASKPSSGTMVRIVTDCAGAKKLETAASSTKMTQIWATSCAKTSHKMSPARMRSLAIISRFTFQ